MLGKGHVGRGSNLERMAARRWKGGTLGFPPIVRRPASGARRRGVNAHSLRRPPVLGIHKLVGASRYNA